MSGTGPGSPSAETSRLRRLEDEVERLTAEVALAWKQGYIEAQHNAARGVDLDAQEAFKDCVK